MKQLDETPDNRMKSAENLKDLVEKMKIWANDLGFAELRISDTSLENAEKRLTQWLSNNYHGTMHYMAAHGLKRCHPEQIVPGTIRIISVRMNYLPASGIQIITQEKKTALSPEKARVSLYARGRDYHRVLRSRLQKLASKIKEKIGPYGYRVFTDSGPIMEVEFAAKAGLGWRGKNSLLVNQTAGTFFFLGEILVDIPLPIDQSEATVSRCGTCTKCFQNCPTHAIIAPQTVDARRCISYLTIELRDSIPVEFRPLIGNRIYGCDDCQLCCPWNRFAKQTTVADFSVRNKLDHISIVELATWTESMFNHRMEGSSIRRIGYECWCRNLAVGMGNALAAKDQSINSQAIYEALINMRKNTSEMVKEHIDWALAQKSS